MPAYDANLFTPPAPVAPVTLRDPVSGAVLADVPMLIDSGADVTLLPRECVTRVGVATDSGPGYELIAFDGTSSIAQSAHLDLLFLRRAFKGRFLLIDQACGILGRDILNHLSLLLDGPNLSWMDHARRPAAQ